MSDWQIGDLALCVRRLAARGAVVEIGEIHTVVKIVSGIGVIKKRLTMGLVLADVPLRDGLIGYDHSAFVKVTPPAADEFDRETIALMNRQEQPA